MRGHYSAALPHGLHLKHVRCVGLAAQRAIPCPPAKSRAIMLRSAQYRLAPLSGGSARAMSDNSTSLNRTTCCPCSSTPSFGCSAQLWFVALPQHADNNSQLRSAPMALTPLLARGELQRRYGHQRCQVSPTDLVVGTIEPECCCHSQGIHSVVSAHGSVPALLPSEWMLLRVFGVIAKIPRGFAYGGLPCSGAESRF